MKTLRTTYPYSLNDSPRKNDQNLPERNLFPLPPIRPRNNISLLSFNDRRYKYLQIHLQVH